jgi:hypothetical protein
LKRFNGKSSCRPVSSPTAFFTAVDFKESNSFNQLFPPIPGMRPINRSRGFAGRAFFKSRVSSLNYIKGLHFPEKDYSEYKLKKGSL